MWTELYELAKPGAAGLPSAATSKDSELNTPRIKVQIKADLTIKKEAYSS